MLVGIDLQDTWEKQRFRISKAYCSWPKWTWCQRLFAKHTNAAISRKADVEEWIDGETPEVFQNTKPLTHLWKMSLTSPGVFQNVFSVRVFLEKDFWDPKTSLKSKSSLKLDSAIGSAI